MWQRHNHGRGELPVGQPPSRPARRRSGWCCAETTQTSDTANGELPEETGGPFPGDGSNGANVLNQSGIVRRDITSSFGSSTTKAEGVPLSITMTINDYANDKAPWLAARSTYGIATGKADTPSTHRASPARTTCAASRRPMARGQVKFTTIFPACYSGRWPHIHFEVYPSLAKATNSANKIATSQMALPEAACKTVYATSGYEQSLQQHGPREPGQ